MSNEILTVDEQTCEAIAEMQKFAVTMYNKGSKDTLIGVVIGAAIGVTVLGVSLFVEWRKSERKVQIINKENSKTIE